MARAKSAFQVYSEYLPLRGLFFLLGALPFALAERLSALITLTLLRILPRRRKMIDANLAASFPYYSDSARARIAEESIQTLGRSVALFARIPRIARAGFSNAVEVSGREHIETATRQGRGVLLFTAHYGCWEMLGAYVPTLFSKAGMVVRPLDNPRLEAMVAGVRSSGGGIVVPRKRIFRDGLRLLRQNGALGILIDQNFAANGVFVDFFGRPAATTTVVSLLARRTGATVIPMHSVWAGNKIKIIFEPPVRLSRHPDNDQAQAEDTQRMTTIVEGWIRDDPGQWLWLHNRWKRRPVAGDTLFTPKTKIETAPSIDLPRFNSELPVAGLPQNTSSSAPRH